MRPVECPVALKLVRAWDAPPLLSIVVPTYNRTAEMVTTVRSLADQLKDGM
jgi:hypothetical protein